MSWIPHTGQCGRRFRRLETSYFSLRFPSIFRATFRNPSWRAFLAPEPDFYVKILSFMLKKDWKRSWEISENRHFRHPTSTLAPGSISRRTYLDICRLWDPFRLPLAPFSYPLPSFFIPFWFPLAPLRVLWRPVPHFWFVLKYCCIICACLGFQWVLHFRPLHFRPYFTKDF